ncbi:MAG: hypothetical protein WAN53_06850, partial [Candidatus Bathyarchaeia archaeon]
VESLEDHRSHGANSPFDMAIRSIEWLGTYEAGKLLAKSDWMKDEISRIYRAPVEKIKVISPNSARWMKDILEAYRDVAGGATH